MTRRASRLAAGGVAGLVLLTGAAFVHLGTRYRDAAERSALVSVTSEAIAAFDPALERPREIAVRLASLARSLDDVTRRAGELAGEGDLPGLVIGTADRTIGVGTTRLGVASMRDLAVEARRVVAAAPSILGPYRSVRGAWVLVVHAAAPDAAAAGAAWVGVTLPVDRLLSASGVDTLPATGFDYELTVVDPRTGQPRSIARSTELGLPVTSEPLRVPTLGPGWALRAARLGAAPAQQMLVAALFVGILALVCGLVVYDLTGRSDRLHAEVRKRADRQQVAERRLMDEVQQRSDAERQLAHASFHDALTGLPNRRYFANRVNHALGELRRQPGGAVAVLVVSFDRFKALNDSLGYAAGDDLLVQAARRIAGCLRESAPVLARVSGDEFGILLSELGDLDAAAAAAERLQEALGKPFQLGEETIFTTASIGITGRATGYAYADELLREADIALSRAEAQGRARVTVFDPAAQEEVVSLQQLETDLHRALEREEFRTYFQPIVALDTGRIAGMETLIRWHHPLEGMVAPAHFIGVAEKTDLIVPINRWVLRQACRQARAWREQLPAGTDFYLSVNLSGHDLREGDLCDYVEGTLREFDLPPGMVRLEVTEGVLIDNVTAANDLVEGLRRIGVPLLLDDFGTGYSSLSYLNRFRVDYLKIDKAFVRRVTPSSRNGSILRAVIHLARDLGIATIAEGIETRADLDQLLELGCDYGQGYHFARPLPAERATELLRSGRQWPTRAAVGPLLVSRDKKRARRKKSRRARERVSVR